VSFLCSGTQLKDGECVLSSITNMESVKEFEVVSDNFCAWERGYNWKSEINNSFCNSTHGL